MHIEIFIFQFKQDIVMKMKLSTNDYEANALAIMDLPFVKKLVEENKKLKRKNKALILLVENVDPQISSTVIFCVLEALFELFEVGCSQLKRSVMTAKMNNFFIL